MESENPRSGHIGTYLPLIQDGKHISVSTTAVSLSQNWRLFRQTKFFTTTTTAHCMYDFSPHSLSHTVFLFRVDRSVEWYYRNMMPQVELYVEPDLIKIYWPQKTSRNIKKRNVLSEALELVSGYFNPWSKNEKYFSHFRHVFPVGVLGFQSVIMRICLAQ